MAPPSLVDQVHELSRSLRGLAGLLPQEDPLAPPPGRKNASSFLFEIKVLTALLSALKSTGWTIDSVKRNGRVRLVRGPAPKRTGSYFRIILGPQEFQLTQGTQIEDRHGEPRAPDISLQRRAASDEPTYDDVIAIWDAKLRGASGNASESRISDNEFRGFIMLRSWLAPPVPGNEPLATWPAAFRVCALISNGQRPSEPASVLLEAQVSVVERFHDANSLAWPTREDHMATQTASPVAATVR